MGRAKAVRGQAGGLKGWERQSGWSTKAAEEGEV